VPQRRPHVERVAAAPCEQPQRTRVDQKADGGDGEHRARGDLGGAVEPPERLDEDPDPERHQRQAVDERREDLRAREAEAAAQRRRPGGEPGREQREGERRRVRAHVRRVREESEAAREPAAHRLDDPVTEREREHRSEHAQPLAGPARLLVAMRVHDRDGARFEPVPDRRAFVRAKGRVRKVVQGA
jgi:hypothetical protein